MNNTPYLGQTTDIILGQEFLTWLWFQSDTAPSTFVDKKGNSFSVSMEQRIVVQGGEGDSLETASVSGSLSPLREARMGLTTGKKVIRALIRIEKDDLAWQLTLKAEDFSYNSLRTPKVERDEDDAGTDALILEKIFLMENCVELLDELYLCFLQLRLSDKWVTEVKHILTWMQAA